jgi:predicted GNAT family acetyltransferase
VIADLHARGFSVPGVMGRAPLALRFADAWTRIQGGSSSITRDERLYALRRVRSVPVPNGSMRPASAEHVEILASWLAAFHDESCPDNPRGDPRAAAQRGIENKRLVLWDDNEPVAMVGSTRRTRYAISVAPVYTPPQRRNRGYATALVAAFCRSLLDDGHRTCCLFADLGNPISNRVYRRVGFHKVCDFAEITFAPET